MRIYVFSSINIVLRHKKKSLWFNGFFDFVLKIKKKVICLAQLFDIYLDGAKYPSEYNYQDLF